MKLGTTLCAILLLLIAIVAKIAFYVLVAYYVLSEMFCFEQSISVFITVLVLATLVVVFDISKNNASLSSDDYLEIRKIVRDAIREEKV